MKNKREKPIQLINQKPFNPNKKQVKKTEISKKLFQKFLKRSKKTKISWVDKKSPNLIENWGRKPTWPIDKI